MRLLHLTLNKVYFLIGPQVPSESAVLELGFRQLQPSVKEGITNHRVINCTLVTFLSNSVFKQTNRNEAVVASAPLSSPVAMATRMNQGFLTGKEASPCKVVCYHSSCHSHLLTGENELTDPNQADHMVPPHVLQRPRDFVLHETFFILNSTAWENVKETSITQSRNQDTWLLNVRAAGFPTTQATPCDRGVNMPALSASLRDSIRIALQSCKTIHYTITQFGLF